MTGLPRLHVLAIRRGSTLQVTGTKVAELRQHLTTKPALGERTQEGFGRFRLDFIPIFETPQSGSPQFTENPEESLFAKAQKSFDEIKDHKKWPKLAQWQALRFNEIYGETLCSMVTKHKKRLEQKDKTTSIAWLKEGPQNKTWIQWLIDSFDEIKADKEQRIYYRALLSLVKHKLRMEEEN
jgi:hypothetical protein